MLDPKTVAEAMDYIVEQAEKSHQLAYTLHDDDDDVDDILAMVQSSNALGNAIGAAKAVRLLCEAEGKSTMRGRGE